jgi:hypothetical protein
MNPSQHRDHTWMSPRIYRLPLSHFIHVATTCDHADDPWFYDHARRAIRIVVVHSKNDRRPNNAQLEYTVPRGALTKLLISHCVEGHGLLTLEREHMARLFVTRQVSVLEPPPWPSHHCDVTSAPMLCPGRHCRVTPPFTTHRALIAATSLLMHVGQGVQRRHLQELLGVGNGEQRPGPEVLPP